jgi:hypothetical protein
MGRQAGRLNILPFVCPSIFHFHVDFPTIFHFHFSFFIFISLFFVIAGQYSTAKRKDGVHDSHIYWQVESGCVGVHAAGGVREVRTNNIDTTIAQQ